MWYRGTAGARHKIFCEASFSLQERQVPLYEFRCIFYIAKVAVYGASVKLCLFLKQKCLFMSFYKAKTLLLRRNVPLCEGQMPLCEHKLPLCEAQLPRYEVQRGFCLKS